MLPCSTTAYSKLVDLKGRRRPNKYVNDKE
jgi:hypothetical protein